MIEQPILYLGIGGLMKLYVTGSLGIYQNIGVLLDGRRKILSQIMFKKRKLVPSPYKLYVDKQSYQKERKKVMDYLIEEIIIKEYQAGHSSTTIMTTLGIIINFINWADNENVEFFQNKIVARKAYEKYTLYLREGIRRGSRKNNSNSTYHWKVVTFLRGLLSDTEGYITAGINPIKMIHTGKNTEKPDETEFAYFFKFYTNFFVQVADFLLEKKKYPSKIELPSGEMWLMPSRVRWILSSDGKYRKLNGFNPETGQIRNLEEMMEKCGYSKTYTARCHLNSLKKLLDESNQNFNSEARLRLGVQALKAYFIHFRTITGMNDSVVSTLLFNEDFEIKKNSQLFRNIKYRAGNKTVEFEIRKEMIGYFHKFLKLRRFLLQGHEIEYLFFTKYGRDAYLNCSQKKGAFGSEIYHSLFKRVDLNLPNITSRVSRVNKLHYTIKNNGIIAAVKLGQSSLETTLNYYHGESEASSDKEMSIYFNSLNKNLIFKFDEGEDISIGQCKNYGEPKTSFVSDSIKIDCKMPEGCLFCEEYGNHADELDIRKLWSLLYIINESRYIAKNEEHFLSVFSRVIGRIEEIFEYIKENREGAEILIEDIQKDVFENENLTSYWENKLNVLVNMGVLK